MKRDATKRLIPTAAAAAAASLLLAGCISTSNSAAVSDLPANWRTDARVESVTLQLVPHDHIHQFLTLVRIEFNRIAKRILAAGKIPHPLVNERQILFACGQPRH